MQTAFIGTWQKRRINSINEFNKLPGGVAAGIEAIGPEASAAMVSVLTQADIDGKLDAEGKASMENLINAVSGSSDEVKVAILTALKPMLDETQYSALVLQNKWRERHGSICRGSKQ